MCHLPPQGISYTLKMEAESSLKCLYLSTQLNGVIIQKTVVIKHITLLNSNIASNLKNKTYGVFAWNLHVTGPPLVGCPWLLVHYVRRQMKTAWRRLAMVQLTTAHHLISILKMVWEFNTMFHIMFAMKSIMQLKEKMWIDLDTEDFLKFFHVAAPADKDQLPLLRVTYRNFRIP